MAKASYCIMLCPAINGGAIEIKRFGLSECVITVSIT